ncbi:MAG: DUF192 domain-containing protein [Chloroflexota bacterium]|nr:DUF192 domain-containing protein [Chloroflexota bacterium]
MTAFSVRYAVLAACVLGLIAVAGPNHLKTLTAAQAPDAACADATAPYAEVQIDGAPRLTLELARTSQEHEVGLMFRTDLAPDAGMLFVYQAQAREAYWMYNTLLPLSIAFIDADGTIVDIQDMPRLSDPSNVQEASQHTYPPAAPYWYALEVNQGWFVQHGVGVGQQMVFCLGG